MWVAVGAAGARPVTRSVIPGDPMGCYNGHEKPTKNCAQTEQTATNQLHARANAQGKCLHGSSVNWLKVKPECWSPGS